jgi:hypothetical protein
VLVSAKLIETVDARRHSLSHYFIDKFGNTAAYGPLKGFTFSDESWWGTSARTPQLLRIYEKEVLDELVTLSQASNTFIDIGAADGYYGVGMVSSGLYERSYCFEQSEVGR